MSLAQDHSGGGEGAWPKGWHQSPSAELHRWFIGVLAAVGFVISALLALYEWQVIDFVWEPLFPGGSHFILRESAISVFFLQTFGFPDAFFGAAAYLAEMLLSAMEGPNRWRTTPWLPILQGLLALGMAAAGLALTAAQAVVFHRWCMLCLASAVISLLIVIVAVREFRASLVYLWRGRPSDVSIWREFWGVAH